MAASSAPNESHLAPQSLTYRKGTIAKLLGVHVRTIERLMAGGKFPKPDARCGSCVLWKPSTIQAWLDAGGGRI
jgi:predicted DNA-binding transcriptional regulator AlpA